MSDRRERKREKEREREREKPNTAERWCVVLVRMSERFLSHKTNSSTVLNVL